MEDDRKVYRIYLPQSPATAQYNQETTPNSQLLAGETNRRMERTSNTMTFGSAAQGTGFCLTRNLSDKKWAPGWGPLVDYKGDRSLGLKTRESAVPQTGIRVSSGIMTCYSTKGAAVLQTDTRGAPEEKPARLQLADTQKPQRSYMPRKGLRGLQNL